MISPAQATLLEWAQASPKGQVEGRKLTTAHALERHGYVQFTASGPDYARMIVTWQGEEALKVYRRHSTRRTEIRIDRCDRCKAEFTWKWEAYANGVGREGPDHCKPCRLEIAAQIHIQAAARLRHQIPGEKHRRDRGVANVKERRETKAR